MPHALLSAPPSIAPIAGQLDIAGAPTLKALPVVVIVFVMAFVDTIGTLIALSSRAGLLDENDNLPEIEKPMLADALVNLVASFVGTTTSGVFVESAAGIEAGGRTGFTAIPVHATGVALVAIGIVMVSPITKLDFSDLTELIPSFPTIVLISFTYNVGVGMTAGLLLYPVLKVITVLRGIPIPLTA
jgi:AGZA family xanthine/uracil permease-like MFS transporter